MKYFLVWHLYHEVLIAVCYDFEDRTAYIKENKPASEVPTRLRLMQPVKGPLPDEIEKAQTDYNKARADSDKARADSDKARADYDKARAACSKARADSDKARADSDKARADSDKAWRALEQSLLEHKSEIEALHKIECPNCPWNGQTIFPEEEAPL